MPLATAAPDLDTQLALIQALIPVALEVTSLAGERYARMGRQRGLVRRAGQPGSIYLADQKIPLHVPRVPDRLGNREVPLVTYEQL